MSYIPVKIKLLHPDAIVPQRATEFAAGVDLHSVEYANLAPGEHRLIKCGFAMELPPRYEAQVRPRSGLALKRAIGVLNSPGTIDADYRGEVGVILINHSQKDYFQINPGDRIAQMVIKTVPTPTFHVVAELSDSGRGTGAFGSTGVAAAKGAA